MSSNSLPSYDDLVKQGNLVKKDDDIDETIPGYAAPPRDDTNNRYKQYANEINPPDHEILVFKPNYLSKRHNILCLREGFSQFCSHVLIVVDSEGKELYNCKDKGNRIVLYDIDKTPILNAYAENSNYQNMRIFEGKKEDVFVGSIKTNDDIDSDQRTYIADFINKITRNDEELEIRYNKIDDYYGVYCNRGLPTETMIGKIKKASNISRKIMIEYAPRVDYMYMLALGVAFLRYEAIRQAIHRKKSFLHGYGGLGVAVFNSSNKKKKKKKEWIKNYIIQKI